MQQRLRWPQINFGVLLGIAAMTHATMSQTASAGADETITRPTPPPLRFGEGSFELTDTPAPVSSIVSADFNHDGHQDLAWISDHDPYDELDQGSSVTIAYGFGDGRFVENLILDQPGSELLAEDFNGDGWVDLAIAGAQLVFRYNLGPVGFGSPINSGIPGTLKSEYGLALTPADVDGDGDLDIIITDAEGRLDTAINRFTTFTLTTGFRSFFAQGRAQTLDYNNDGLADILYIKSPNTLILRKGLGDGTFSVPNPVLTGFSSVSVYTPPEPAPQLVLVSKSFEPGTQIYQAHPVAGIAPEPMIQLQGTPPGEVPVLVDLDADSSIDLVQGNHITYRALETLGTSRTGTSPIPLTNPAGINDLESILGPSFILVDINDDGTPDRVEPGYVRLNLRDENILPRHAHITVGPTLDIHSHVASADLDNDGLPDVIASGFNVLELRYGTPTGPANSDAPLGPPLPLSHGLSKFSGFITILTDLNNDGLTDIVALDRSPRISAILNLGNRTFSPPQPLTLTAGISEIAGIATADLDNDGDPDFVVSNDTDNRLQTILNNNGVLKFGPTLNLPDAVYTTVTLLDINGDDHPDAVLGDASNNQIVVALGQPGGTFSLLGSVFVPAPPYWLTNTDANSDGIDDLLVTTRDTDGGPSPIVIWHRTPQHTIEFIPVVIPTTYPALEAFAADLNADGNNDLITVQTYQPENDEDSVGRIVVYDGDPEIAGWPDLERFSTTLVEIEDPFPAGVIAPDLNADSLPDLLWCSDALRLDIALQSPTPMGPCRTDIQGDTYTDTADITAFVQLFIAGHPAADLNRDTIVDTADITEFVDRFIAGC